MIKKLYKVKKAGDYYSVYKGSELFQDGLTKANANKMASDYNDMYIAKQKRFGLV